MLKLKVENVQALPTKGLADYEHNGTDYTIVAVPDGWHIQCGVVLVAHLQKDVEGYQLTPFWGDTSSRRFPTLTEALAGVAKCEY